MRRAVAIVAVVACLALAGCGSGDDTASVTGASAPSSSPDTSTSGSGAAATDGDGTPVGRTEPAGALELVRVRLAAKRLAPKVGDPDAPAIAQLRVGDVDVLAYREPTAAVQAAQGIRRALGSGDRPASDVGVVEVVEVVGTHLYTTSVAKGRLTRADRGAFDEVVRVGERP